MLWGTTLLFSIFLMLKETGQSYFTRLQCIFSHLRDKRGNMGFRLADAESSYSGGCLKSKFYKPGPKGLIGNGLFLQEWCLGDCDNSNAQQNLWGFRKLSLVIPKIPLKCEHKISQQNSTRTSTWKYEKTKAPQCTHKYSMISTSSKSTSGILSINSLLSWAASFKLIFILINFNSPLSWAACFIN